MEQRIFALLEDFNGRKEALSREKGSCMSSILRYTSKYVPCNVDGYKLRPVNGIYNCEFKRLNCMG